MSNVHRNKYLNVTFRCRLSGFHLIVYHLYLLPRVRNLSYNFINHYL